MTHGVFTHSKVKDPNDPNDDGVKVDAAVARYHPRTKRLKSLLTARVTRGASTSIAEGNAFISACVIDHLFSRHPGVVSTSGRGALQQSIFLWAAAVDCGPQTFSRGLRGCADLPGPHVS
jgi:hypothetical protein